MVKITATAEGFTTIRYAGEDVSLYKGQSADLPLTESEATSLATVMDVEGEPRPDLKSKSARSRAARAAAENAEDAAAQTAEDEAEERDAASEAARTSSEPPSPTPEVSPGE